MGDKQVILITGSHLSRINILTKALGMLDSRLVNLKMHHGVAGSIRDDEGVSGNILIPRTEFEQMIENDAILWFEKQGNEYKGIAKEQIEKVGSDQFVLLHMEKLEDLDELSVKLNGRLKKVFFWEPLHVLERRLVKRFENNMGEVNRQLDVAKEKLLHIGSKDFPVLFDHIIEDTRSPVDTGLELIYNLEENMQFQEEVENFQAYIKELGSS